MIRLLFPLILLPASALAEPWVRHTIDDTSQGADGVKLGDINTDGRLDIATGWEEGGLVRVYLHPGPDRVKDRWPAVTVGRVGDPEDAVFADVDNDGILDVVSCCEGKTKAIFFHRLTDRDRVLEEEAWTTERVTAADGYLWMQCVPIELPPARRTGLIVGSKGENGVVAGLFPPDPRSDESGWRLVPIREAGWIMSLELTQTRNPRGHVEQSLIVSDRKGAGRGVYSLVMPSDPAAPNADWGYQEIGGSNHEPMFVAVDESPGWKANGLRVSNRAAAATSGGPLLNFAVQWGSFGDITWDERTVIPMPPNTGTGKAVAIGDLDGDGRDDLAVTCENAKGKVGVFWLKRQELGEETTWEFHDISGVEGTKFDRIELIDLDGDGDLDLLTCEEREGLGVIWYENPLR